MPAKISRIITLVFLVALLGSCAHGGGEAPVARPAKIALVLGAGSARGFAHIGVLKVLEANGIPIHLLVGTSAGAFVGSLYAAGYSSYDLQKMAVGIERGEIVDLAIPDNGFIKGEKIAEYINRAVKDKPIEELKIPFCAVATDVQNGKEHDFRTGNTGDAVRASCSIPGIFRSPTINTRSYIDGGAVSPVAVDTARRLGADLVIAVHLLTDVEAPKPETTIETILQAVNIMYARLAENQLAGADVVIRPHLAAMSAGDFSRKHDAIMDGERAALEALPAIRALLDRLRREGRLAETGG